MTATTAAGYVQLVRDVAQRDYGIAASLLDAVAPVAPAVLDDPLGSVPSATFFALLRFVSARSADPGLGLRLAHALDLRTQGFWGYALLSSGSVRERVAIHARYQQLRGLVAFCIRSDDEAMVVECGAEELPPDLASIVLDFGFAGAAIQHRRRVPAAQSGLLLWLT